MAKDYGNERKTRQGCVRCGMESGHRPGCGPATGKKGR